MRNSRRATHPATLYLLLMLVVVVASWICNIYGWTVTLPQTGEELRVQSLLSPEGLRWWLRNAIGNFTGFAPLGMALVAMFGLGVAEHSGFLHACVRFSIRNRTAQRRVLLAVIAAGILSNVMGDGGYILLLPIAAILFQWVGLHPVVGIVTAYVSVACGYSANVFISTVDPMLAHTTQEAALSSIGYRGNAEALCNYFFMAASTFVLVAVIYFLTRRYLLPAMGEYTGDDAVPPAAPLSRKERRALSMAWIVFGLYVAVILWLTFSPYGILRGVNGGLMHSPFIAGISFMLSLGIGLAGMIYGFYSGRYRSDNDLAAGLAMYIRLLCGFFAIAFFASQMFAALTYSHLDKCLAVAGANWLTTSFAWSNGFGLLVAFVLFVAAVNLFMVSATAKWSLLAFVFVPVFARLGVSPDVVQCAFRVGDSATNAITPFMFYMPLAIACIRRYMPLATYGTLLRHTWLYAVVILAVWLLLFAAWYSAGIPFGL